MLGRKWLLKYNDKNGVVFVNRVNQVQKPFRKGERKTKNFNFKTSIAIYNESKIFFICSGLPV